MSSPSSPLTGIVRRGYVAADPVAAFAQYPAYIMVYIGDDSAGGGGTDAQPCTYMADYTNYRVAGDYVLLLGQPGAYTIMGSLGNTTSIPAPMVKSWPRSSGLSKDTLTTNSFTVILSNTWTAAPAGRYKIGCNFVHDSAGIAVTYFRLTANGVSMVLNGSSEDCRIDTQSADPTSESFQGTYDHSGGDLAVVASIDTTGTGGHVYTAGTTAWAEGPYPFLP